MSTNSIFARAGVGTMLAVWSLAVWSDPHGWPLDPKGADHPIGNTLGEVVRFEIDGKPATYQHEGLDILAIPDGTSGAPDVFATVSGVVVNMDMTEFGRDNYIRIEATDRKSFYIYGHLEYSSVSQSLIESYNETVVNGDGESEEDDAPNPLLVNAGDRIGKVRNAFACDFDHLHYQLDEKLPSGKFITRNPLIGIEPEPDAFSPELEIHLAKRVTAGEIVSRSEIKIEDPQMCTAVSGDVEVIAEVHDRDDANSTLAGAGNVGLYDLKWRACTVESPDCEWNNTHTYDWMPPAWEDSINVNNPAPKRFSFETPWETKPEPWLEPKKNEQCPLTSQDRTFVILTSFDPGPWKTAGAHGEYIVSVKASDLADNVTTRSVKVCIED